MRRRTALSVSFVITCDITIGKETRLLNNIHVTDLKNFERHLPPSFQTLVSELGKRGYLVIVVGGIVRDYFLEGIVGKDWDIEVTHPTLAWDLKAWKDLGKELGKAGRVTFLPYDVMRISIQGLEYRRRSS